MVNFTVDQIRSMMDRKDNIRNISVIAHVDHGKSTLTDSLIGKAGIIADARQGEARFMDTRDDEQARSITIKATSVSLYYERTEFKDEDEKESYKKPYLINLIDSPGHVDFSSEVTAALRVTDGALVVVDCIEGVCVQTETVLRQAIAERIRPILFLNKLDRIFLELSPTLDECYKNFRNSIESVNVICQTYRDEKLGSVEVLPQEGKVGFGSGLHAWGFTLRDFAKMYSSKFGLSVPKMMAKLWGENYYSAAEKKWVKKNTTGKMMRGFEQFVLGPIKIMFDSIMSEQKDVYEPIIETLNLKLAKKDVEKAMTRQKDYLKLVMRTWIPAGDALLDMIAEHLPSPATAQAYRVENLYSGPLDSAEAASIRTCDASGPMGMYVSKMVPTAEKGRFIAFGRVFSGTIKTGQEIRILGPDYEVGKKKDLFLKKVQRTLLMMGRYVEQIPDCPAGNVCGLVGIDQFLLKSGTLTSSAEMHPFVTMKFSVAAVVQVAVEPKNAADLPKLVEGLKRLAKSDPLVKCSTSKSGQHIIAGAGELHLEICLKDLREDYMKGAEVRVSEPVVSFAETIESKTGDDGKHPSSCVSKSPNKHNRLYMYAEPLLDKFAAAVGEGDVVLPQSSEMKAFGRRLADEFEWDVGEARKIWTFGCPPDGLGNCIVDMTKGVQFLNEIKDHVVGAFMQVTTGGVLCDEVMRGIRFNITDVKLHADAIHRGAGQIMPCAKKVLFACQIASGPKLLEPMYLVDITVPQSAHSGVFNTLNTKRGEIEKIEDRVGTPLSQIQAYLPVLESFGFTELLRKNTGGQAFPQMKFSHWKLVSGDPFAENSPANTILMDTRKRKGLKVSLPVFGDYYDKV
mmetsp:Transcript_45157/g.74866  ORF Transcript_45157/g.74866 Transcript_45157/m.74866 type:complete len:852 (-) Transcript_45157:249-2804(-)|eukprot:CAMPEP_0202686106 /NCGR_PEP_ID=MMETSP1385-20130828/1905_1 /ASSEMBLY_ACC=CAM_ASM_000861 /TAXON_ID=933848 /ORGANISM="Elphidium margaritaceum" /LENGTH=851 /DNA_ID=CAMNT_0049340621 /DNA_START=93 /DNA_END=2648 /DNA_ORIENTATION=+